MPPHSTLRAIVLVLLGWVTLVSGAACWTNNFHTYEVVSTGDSISWASALAAAAARTDGGCTGYLATITSLAENNFIASVAVCCAEYWLGGAQYPGDPTTFQWVTGPETGQNISTGYDPSTVCDQSFCYYGPGEPSGDVNGHLEFQSFGTVTWNDQVDTAGVQNYIVEYGDASCLPINCISSTPSTSGSPASSGSTSPSISASRPTAPSRSPNSSPSPTRSGTRSADLSPSGTSTPSLSKSRSRHSTSASSTTGSRTTTSTTESKRGTTSTTGHHESRPRGTTGTDISSATGLRSGLGLLSMLIAYVGLF